MMDDQPTGAAVDPTAATGATAAGTQAGSEGAATAASHRNRLLRYFARIPGLSANARLYLLGTSFMALGHGALWVHMNLYFRSLGMGEAVIGRILSANALGTVIMAIPAALWVDRIPAGRVFALTAGGFSLAFATSLIVTDPFYLAAASCVTGMLFTVHLVAAAPFFMRNAAEGDRIYLFGFLLDGQYAGGWLHDPASRIHAAHVPHDRVVLQRVHALPLLLPEDAPRRTRMKNEARDRSRASPSFTPRLRGPRCLSA